MGEASQKKEAARELERIRRAFVIETAAMSVACSFGCAELAGDMDVPNWACTTAEALWDELQKRHKESI